MNDEKLTGGAKAGYFFLGLVLAVIGILIAWLVNKDKPVMKEAIKFAVIGFVVELVLTCIVTAFFTFIFAVNVGYF